MDIASSSRPHSAGRVQHDRVDDLSIQTNRLLARELVAQETSGTETCKCVRRTATIIPIGDFHCGLRGFSREAIRQLCLTNTGMEFASEMIVKSALRGLKISEVPTTLSTAGRCRPPHLRTWRDGWRHLRFLLLHSPRWLFLYPGLFFVAIGLVAIGTLWAGPVQLAPHVVIDIHSLVAA